MKQLLQRASLTLPPLHSNLFQADKAAPIPTAKEASVAPPAQPVQAEPLVQTAPPLPSTPTSTQTIPLDAAARFPFPVPPYMGFPYPYSPDLYGYPLPFSPLPIQRGPLPGSSSIFPPVDPRLHQHMQVPSHSRVNPAIQNDRSSPPPPAEASVEDMCEKHRLGHSFVTRLAELKFEIGDNLSILTEDDWRRVGFDKLEWERVLTAYRRYKCSFNSN